jgi:hypothetical protein
MTDDLKRLESDLRRLSRAVAWPPRPSLAAAVRRRLEAEAKPEAARPRPWLLAGAALAAAVALALVLGLWAPSREAVADFFDRLRIFQTEESPAGLPSEIVGTPVSLARAEERLGFPLKEPAYPEGAELQRTLLQEFEGFSSAVLFYDQPSGPGFALFQTAGGLGKGLPFEAAAEPVAGLGDAAYWLEGLRIAQYYDEQGQLIEESRRATDANTLIWGEGGVLFRLEGDLSQDEAVRIAKSLR